jgi:hypothetical protein
VTALVRSVISDRTKAAQSAILLPYVPRSALQTSLAALTESLVDSVMDAIRSASLEDLLGQDPGPRTAPAQVERVSVTRRARARRRRSVALPRPADPEPPRSVATDDLPEPEPASEITDPDLVLGFALAGQVVDEEPQPSPEKEERPSGYQVRLRENETLARASNAGVVIRRSR